MAEEGSVNACVRVCLCALGVGMDGLDGERPVGGEDDSGSWGRTFVE